MLWLIIAILITAADQTVKYIVSALSEVGDTLFSVGGLFSITHVHNTGAAFSIMSGKMSVLSIISVVFCVGVIVYWIRKKPTHPLLCTAVTMMFSGAFSNAIDRIFRGYVEDCVRTLFIDFPVFNIADISITVGAALLVVYFIFFDKEDKNEKNNAETV